MQGALAHEVSGTMKLDWNLLTQLEKELGDAFYILDIQRFRRNYREFLDAFCSIYPKTNIAYSYKTNYIPEIGRAVHQMGGYAEVVSQLEYDLATQVGVPLDRIVFNGPLKSEVELEKALLGGSLVNLDSWYEVALVERIAEGNPHRQIAVGLRCNFDLGTGFPSRFGFDTTRGDLESAFHRLNELENCRVEGLHCHFSSPRTVQSYSIRARKMLDLCQRLYSDGSPPRYLDLGGGFFGRMSEELKREFDQPIPDYQDYAAAIAHQFAQAFPDNSGPELVLEPGVALVADTMTFVARIIDIKITQSRKFALTTGSIHNIKPTLHSKNLPMLVLHNQASPQDKRVHGPLDLVGYTCMENDTLYHGYRGTLAPGDFVAFSSVGAYSIVFKPPFIRSSPAIIAYDFQRNQYQLVKRREQLDDLFASYNL